jgi:hypothetical protein
MYLPVPVNFIFIGFEGKGNQGLFDLIAYHLFLKTKKKKMIGNEIK